MAGKKTGSSKARRKRRRWILAALGAPFGALLAVVLFMFWSTRGAVFTDAKDLPSAPVAIVFGAGLHKGKPSLILQGRLDASIQLYKTGRVQKLLMSGDNRTRNYNEPEAMRRYAVEHQVPNADIMLDYGGRDTYDTCYRAKKVFGVTRAILVTQGYHAPRAVYIARGMGIDVAALAVPNLDQFPALQLDYTAREWLADVKAIWDMTITHRAPSVDRLAKS